MEYLSKNRLKGLPSPSAVLFLLTFLMVILAGCASTDKVPTSLFPVLGEKTDAMKKMGYTPHGRFWGFSNTEVSIQVSHITPETIEPTYIDVVDELTLKGYIFLKLEIKNQSGRIKITYNPALTSLTTDSLDFKKPLDYTDFYEFVKEGVGASKQLQTLSTIIYDNTQTIGPAQTMSKYLIFTPLSKDSTVANLEIKEIYIGTKPYSLLFPFQLQKHSELLP